MRRFLAVLVLGILAAMVAHDPSKAPFAKSLKRMVSEARVLQPSRMGPEDKR